MKTETETTKKASAPETRKLSMGERYADIVAEDRKAATGEGNAPRVTIQLLNNEGDWITVAQDQEHIPANIYTDKQLQLWREQGRKMTNGGLGTWVQ